jgi:hypothetical protein
MPGVNLDGDVLSGGGDIDPACITAQAKPADRRHTHCRAQDEEKPTK